MDEMEGDIQHVKDISSNQISIPSELVQINANSTEINRRIASFIKRKRDELNRNNLQDFCFHGTPVVENEHSCARVDSILIRNKGSHSHLKVSRVENVMGPQTEDVRNITESIVASSQTSSLQFACPAGVDERLCNAEKFLGLSSGGSFDVFSRLKAVEDRILYLESISPEYVTVSNKIESGEVSETKKATTEELRQKVARLEKKLQTKVSSYSIR